MDDRQALTDYTTGELARLFTLVVGLAALSHPEEVRRALGSVFDLAAVEEAHRRMMALLQKCYEEIDRLNDRIAQMHRRIDQAAKKFKHTLQETKREH